MAMTETERRQSQTPRDEIEFTMESDAYVPKGPGGGERGGGEFECADAEPNPTVSGSAGVHTLLLTSLHPLLTLSHP